MPKLNKIYFDNVSTTKPFKEVLDTYTKLLNEYYCNSDALYDDGVASYRLQETSRANIAKILNVNKDEIIFTSGASEANSLAIKGLSMKQFKDHKKGHIISSIYEHSSTYNTLIQLRDVFGFDVTFLNPNEEGKITKEAILNAINKDTFLVTLMYVNNELGTINDIKDIKEALKKVPGVLFHVDMTQALAKVDCDLKDIDMASFSAHKIHGLKGSGFLYKKKHIELLPLISGGQQEFGVRGGTSNSPTNIVLAKTLRLAMDDYQQNKDYLKELHDYAYDSLNKVENVKINSPKDAISSIINFSTTIKSEVLLNAFNKQGIMVSSKSTCGSRQNEPSRVLKSMNIDDEYAIRISFDAHNTKDEIDYFITCLKENIKKYG